MYAQIEKPKKNKSRSFASSVAQKKSSVRQGGGIVDNRSEAIQMRKLQEMEDNSPTIVNLSGYSTDDTKAQFDSDKPAQLMPVTQLQKITVFVTGITHLVEMVNGSIMEGVKRIQVKDGDEIQIESAVKFRSRRGPNQEVFRETDLSGGHEYRWFLVKKINGVTVPRNYFIRDETFNTVTPKALGSRSAKISDFQRDRISLDEIKEHNIAANIISASEHLPELAMVENVVGQFLQENKTVHDPKRTLRLMRICYALSQDGDINGLIKTKKDSDLMVVKKVVNILEKVSRQIIQVWDNPVNDIGQRAEAWYTFVLGIKELKNDRRKLFQYINNCLVHDKGYAQTHESCTSYLLYTADNDDVDEKFDAILERALNEEANFNIWVGGMAGSGKYKDQLTRSKESEVKLMTADSHEKQELAMWSNLLAPIMNARFGVREKDWKYINTILENQDILYEKVRKLVPISFELHKDFIKKAYDFF